ncbi:MAG: hypothetical protein IJU26_05410 [Synergistaceae bacterium]|nr:hypothetical protein [Synergistaceae bacterium]
MKIDTRYGSMWDELPPNTTRRIPRTQQEAQTLHQAAQSSMHNSLITAWDSHNDMVAKSAELRKLQHRKDAIERIEQQRHEKHTQFLKDTQS